MLSSNVPLFDGTLSFRTPSSDASVASDRKRRKESPRRQLRVRSVYATPPERVSQTSQLEGWRDDNEGKSSDSNARADVSPVWQATQEAASQQANQRVACRD